MRTVQTKPVMLPATPALPTFQSQSVLDSPGKLTSSTRSTATPRTPLRSGLSSLNSSIRDVGAHAEPEGEPLVWEVMDSRVSWDRARRSVRSKNGSPLSSLSPRAAASRQSSRISCPKPPANRSSSCQSPRTLQPTGERIPSARASPVAFDHVRKSVAARLPPRAKTCSHSRSPSPRRKCEACGHHGDIADNQSNRPGFLHGQLVDVQRAALNNEQQFPGAMTMAHGSQTTIATSGAYGHVAGPPMHIGYVTNRGLLEPPLPMEADELDAHVAYCAAIREAVGEMTNSTLRDMQLHSNNLQNSGIDGHADDTEEDVVELSHWNPWSRKAVYRQTHARQLTKKVGKSKKRSISNNSTDSTNSDRTEDDQWCCNCRENSESRGRHARNTKADRGEATAYGVTVSL